MRLSLLFLLCALPLGLVLARLTPVGEVPDETAHIVRAYAVSTGQWVGRRIPPSPGQTAWSAGFKIDSGLYTASFASHEPNDTVTAAVSEQRRATGWSHITVLAGVPNTAAYAPLFYLVSGAVLGLGRWAGAGPVLCTDLARIANLLAFACIGASALFLARRMRFVLFALLCLPSSVSLAASVNQDGLLIAATILAAALLTRPDIASRRWAAVALATVGLAKPPYLPLVALLLAPPGRWRWPEVGSGVGLAVVAALPGVAWSLAALSWTVVPLYVPGPHFDGSFGSFVAIDSAAQFAFLMADPVHFFRAVLHTIVVSKDLWPREIVGVLGQLSLLLPTYLYAAWYFALGCAVLGDVLTARPSASPWNAGRASLAVGAALAAALLIFTAEYLTWTPLGAGAVAGIQGRYFVPLLAAAALAVPGLPVLRGAEAALFNLPAVAVSAAQFTSIPLLVVRRWYLH